MTREQAIALYEDVMETMPQAGEKVRDACEALNDAYEAYCSEVEYETFAWAYELGYKAGKEAAKHEP